MKGMLGGTWKGIDGTMYHIVEKHAVKLDEPRWWLDVIPEDGDTVCGPRAPDRLHLLPAEKCGPEIRYALVVRS